MTLDAIIEHYDRGTLADLPDQVLHDALTKIIRWHNWRKMHPDDSPRAVPPADRLNLVANSIERLSQRRYGCND